MIALQYLPCHSLPPLQMHRDQVQTVGHQTVLYLWCQLPDTAGEGRTSANHGPPFHALVDAGQQVSGPQPAAICQLPQDPSIAS